MLTNLAKVADLKVISRTSVAQYKAAAARNLRDIGQALGVAHILEGSVQRVANKVRVNAQLVDARNDAHLWAQTYTRDLADVFAIQSQIAEAIAQQLQAHLSADEKARIEKPPTTDPVAYDLYLRARQLDDLSNDPDAKSTCFKRSACWTKQFDAIRNSCVRTVSCARLISICIGAGLTTPISGANWPAQLCKKRKRSSRTPEKSMDESSLRLPRLS